MMGGLRGVGLYFQHVLPGGRGLTTNALEKNCKTLQEEPVKNISDIYKIS